LSQAVSESSRGIDEFRLDEGSAALYHFFWDELCDWFLEATKPVFSSGSEADKAETRQVLAHVLETALRALHPFLPFITEELWQRLPRPAARPASIALAPYPTADDGRRDPEVERDMDILMEAIGAARTIRSEHGIDKSAKVPLEIRAANARVRSLVDAQAALVAFLVGTDGAPRVSAPSAERPRGSVVSVAGDVEVLVVLAGLVDRAKEEERIDRGLKKLDKDIAVLEKRLASENFVKNAPPEVVAEARAQLEQLKRQKERLLEAKDLLKEL
jgi:valyl-tRNA synthetase